MDIKEIEEQYKETRDHGAAIYQLTQRIKELEANIADPEWCCADHKLKLLERIKGLEADLSLNKSMLSRQTDLAREAECRAMEAEREKNNWIETARQYCRNEGFYHDILDQVASHLTRMKLKKIPLVEVEDECAR